MDWFRFDLAKPLPVEFRPYLKALAGAYLPRHGRFIMSGLNSAWMIQELLRQAGLSVKRVAAPDHLQQPPTSSVLGQVPRPMEMRQTITGMDKEWPGYLLPWQSDFILKRGHFPGSHLWWAPGSGKTLSEIHWALLSEGRIIVVTRSAATRTIAADIRRFTTASYFILEGEKKQHIDTGTRILIIGWAVLRHHVETLLEWNPTSVVFDEVHRGKSHKRLIAVPRRDSEGNHLFNDRGELVMDFHARDNMTSAAKALSMRAKRRLGATGTPVMDRLRDLWAQLDLVEPDQWGFPYDWFRRYAAAKEGKWGGIDTKGKATPDLLNELMLRLEMSVHQVAYAVTHANLPDKRRLPKYIPRDQLLTDETGEARQAVADAAKSGVPSRILWARLAAAAARLRPVMAEDVLEYLGTQNKICVITGLRKECVKLHDEIRKRLDKAGRGNVRTWWAHGDTPPELRDIMEKEYMAHPGPCVLVGTIDAWGESVNLQDTDVALVGMLPITPGKATQLEGRWRRQGMRRPLLIVYYVGEGTVMEHIAQLLIDKLPAVERIDGPGSALEGFRQVIGGIENEEQMAAAVAARIAGSAYEVDEDAR
jgi:hypothetical protein